MSIKKVNLSEDQVTRFKESLKSIGVSQSEAAKAGGVSPSYLSEILSLKKEPVKRTFSDLCNGVSLNENYILTGEGPMLDERASAPAQPELIKETDGKYSPKEVVVVNLMRGLDSEDERDKLYEDFLAAYMKRIHR